MITRHLATVLTTLAASATALAQERVPAPAPAPTPEAVQRVNALDARAEAAAALAAEAARGGPDLDALGFAPTTHLLGGRPVSLGATWKANYAADGMTFTPALGREAPATRSFVYRFEGARVGDRPLAGVALDVEPRLDGDRVRFVRGRGLVETYEATDGGLKQSFVFDELPSRAGDLVVHGRLSTTMTRDLAATTARALEFVEPELARVRIDTVLGIDARGTTVEGELSLDGERLELRLPAAFVAEAELPLVLDPLYSPEFIGSQPFDSDQVDIAAGQPSLVPVYGMVFARYYSANDPDITAAVFADNGADLVPQFAIESTIGTFDQGPAIAYNRSQETFAVTWQRGTSPSDPDPDVLATHFNATNGAVQPYATLGPGRQPDIAASRTGGDRAVVVWQRGNLVRARDYRVLPGAGPFLGTTVTVFDPTTTGNGYTRPAITKTDNDLGLYLVAVENNYVPDRDLIVTALDTFGVPVANDLFVTTIGPDEERPDLAADDEDFMLVFEREAVAGNFDADVIARKVDLTPLLFGYSIAFDGPEIVVEADPFDDEKEPAVAAGNDEWVVVWQDERESLANYDVFLTTIDQNSCELCEPEVLVSSGVGSNVVPEVTSTLAATGSAAIGAQVGIAYTQLGSGTVDRVRFRFWDETGPGTTYDITQPGCLAGGQIGILGSADLASTNFSVTLSGADPLATVAILNLAVPGTPTPCGPCSVLPLGLLLQHPVVAGAAEQGFGVPCNPSLQGQSVQLQWIVGPSAAAPCAASAGFAFSNVLGVTFDY